MDALEIPLNFEMAATEEMLKIALRHKPHAACIVPEKREELTTEGGLDAVGGHNHLKPIVAELGRAGIRVSLFIDPDPKQLDAAVSLGAPVVELHTGRYCEVEEAEREAELARRERAACADIESFGAVDATSVLRFLLPLDGVALSVDPWLKFCAAPGSVRGGWKAAAVARRQRSVASLGIFF